MALSDPGKAKVNAEHYVEPIEDCKSLCSSKTVMSSECTTGRMSQRRDIRPVVVCT